MDPAGESSHIFWPDDAGLFVAGCCCWYRPTHACYSTMRACASPPALVRWVGGVGCQVRNPCRRRGVRLHASDAEDTLSALDRLVSGVSGPPESTETITDDVNQPPKEPPSTAIVREILVPLDPPDNIAVTSFEVQSASTRIVQSVVSPPLGIVFETNEINEIVVTEVLPGSNAKQLGPEQKIVPGDILRACSTMIPEMKYNTGGLMLGGNGRPGFRRVLFVTPVGEELKNNNGFDQTMAAIVSNAKAGDFDVNVVLERRTKGN